MLIQGFVAHCFQILKFAKRRDGLYALSLERKLVLLDTSDSPPFLVIDYIIEVQVRVFHIFLLLMNKFLSHVMLFHEQDHRRQEAIILEFRSVTATEFLDTGPLWDLGALCSRCAILSVSAFVPFGE